MKTSDQHSVTRSAMKTGRSMPLMDGGYGNWEQQIGAARNTWRMLTDDELLNSEGQVQKLAGLIQERYALSQEQADKAVQSFFATMYAPYEKP